MTLASARIAAKKAWDTARDHAAMHRGLLLVAPVFWGAFAVFLHPGYAFAGFIIHAILCLPRKRAGQAALFLAFPLTALWFAVREPYLTLPETPFHRVYVAEAKATEREGVVASQPASSSMGWSFLVRETTGKRLTYRASLESSAPPRQGATIRLRGTAAPVPPPPNPGQLDMRRVLRSQGAAAALRADSWKEVRPPRAWARMLAETRTALRASLDKAIPAVARPLPEAALLNVTDNVPESTRDAFLRSGMQHVLAISGQHIGILIAFLMAFARCVRLPRKAAFAIAGLMTAVYIPLVGEPVSVVRSGITFACIVPAVLLERRTSGLHALCLTAAIDLLFDPHNILNLGFQLSYAATLALVLGAGPLQHAATRALSPLGLRDAWPVSIVQLTLLSTLIALFTYPVLASSTHATTPWGILGNLAAGPIGAAMLVGGLFVWAFDFLLPWPLDAASEWAGALTGACALLLEGCVSLLARLPGALRPVADAPAAWLAALSAGCGITALLLRRERFLAATLCAGLCIAAETIRPLLEHPKSGEARVTFLAVGHGDAAVLELSGAVMLIDAGDSPRIAHNVIAPFLRYRGIARIDVAMVTHPDLDHFGGMAALTSLVSVGRFVGPPALGESSASWNCLQNTVRSRGIPWFEGRAGQRVYANPTASLRLLGPGVELDGADKNDRSLVALLRVPSGRVLFTGDIEHAGQRALAASWPLWRGAWLKAPHHGSDRTTLPCFPAAVSAPRVAISCGGRRGFPGPRTMEALAEAGSAIAVTKQRGAITWTFGRRGAFEAHHLAPN
jgi:competence protein ComEC